MIHAQAPLSHLTWLDSLIEAMSNAVLAVDSNGKIVAVNDSLARLLELPDRSAALCPLDELPEFVRTPRLPDDMVVSDEIRRALGGQTVVSQRVTLVTASGQERIISFTTSPVRDATGDVVLAMFVAQDRTQAERVRRYWQAVGTAARSLSTELDVAKVLESVADQIAEGLGGQVVLGIWWLDDSLRSLHLRLARGIGPETREILADLPVGGDSFICRAAQTGEIQWVEDARDIPPESELDQRLVRDEGLVCWAGAPLRTGDSILGTVGYGLREAQRFTEEDLRAIETIAGLFAVAIEHAELYQQSEARRRDAEESQRLRTQFFAAVAHDLGQPLTAISGQFQLLQRIPAERHGDILDRIRAQINRMERMLKDLLEASRLVDARLQIAPRPADLVQILRGVLTSFEAEALSHTLTLVAPEKVVGAWDADRLAQVFENLLTNATKYSPAGSEVRVSIAEVDAEVRVAVNDRGRGLTPEQIERLFQPFARLPGTSDIRGVGLGLYITR